MSGPHYLLIGSGRLATHIGRYFGLKGIPFSAWSRRQLAGELEKSLTHVTHVWVLISDDQIAPFIRENAELFRDKKLLHASGSLILKEAESAHPLASFTGPSYDLNFYERVPFVTERGRTPFERLFPGLKNPAYEIDPALKPLYHGLCVVAGNFTTLLWREAADRFESKLGLDSKILGSYMESIARNIQLDPGAALTGPLARGDRATIEKNLEALKGDPLEGIYRAFLKYWESDTNRGRSAK